MTKTTIQESHPKTEFKQGATFISHDKTVVVMVSEDSDFDDSRYFSGMILHSNNGFGNVGTYSFTLLCSDFQPFYGKIIIER